MNIDRNESQIIDYLYGEMDAQSKKAFEKKLSEDPALKAEVDSLQKVQFTLRKWKDEPLPGPVIVSYKKPESRLKWIYPVLKVAAGILVLVLFAALTNLRVQVKDQSISFAFGQPSESVNDLAPPVLEANINPIVEAAVQANNQELNTKIQSYESKLLSALEDNETKWRSYIQSAKVNQSPPVALDNFVTLEDLSSILDAERQRVKEDYDVLVEHLVGYINGMQNENKRLIQTGFENITKNLMQTNQQQSLNANLKNY